MAKNTAPATKTPAKAAAKPAPTTVTQAIATLRTKDGHTVPKLKTLDGHRFGGVWMGEARNKGKLVLIERTFTKLQATATQLGIKFSDKTTQEQLATKVSEKLQAFNPEAAQA